MTCGSTYVFKDTAFSRSLYSYRVFEIIVGKTHSVILSVSFQLKIKVCVHVPGTATVSGMQFSSGVLYWPSICSHSHLYLSFHTEV